MTAYWKRNLSEDSPIIIFVHGVMSSASKCWRKTRSGDSWPTIAVHEPEMDDWSVYVAEYHTAINSGRYSISDAAVELWSSLSDERVFNGRPIVFVCHSMGGIVVRRMLLQHQGEISPHATTGLLLVASPTNGSYWAAFFRVLAKVAKHYQALALQPVESNEWLRELAEDFRHLIAVGRHRILGHELVEHWIVWLGRYVPQLRPIVARGEGTGVFNIRPEMIPKSTHFSIVAPRNYLAQQHRALKRLIERMREAMYTLSFSIPEGSRFSDLPAVLTQVLKTPVEFRGFTESEMNAVTQTASDVRGVTPERLIQSVADAFPVGAIQDYRVEKIGAALRAQPCH